MVKKLSTTFHVGFELPVPHSLPSRTWNVAFGNLFTHDMTDKMVETCTSWRTVFAQELPPLAYRTILYLGARYYHLLLSPTYDLKNFLL